MDAYSVLLNWANAMRLLNDFTNAERDSKKLLKDAALQLADDPSQPRESQDLMRGFLRGLTLAENSDATIGELMDREIERLEGEKNP